MSTKYPGGIISKTAPVPTGPYENGTAPGVWTLEQQAEFVRQGIWPIAGNVPNYIEDVFSTWVYTGTGASQTITNGINLASKGGLVWVKNRGPNSGNPHILVDTVRGVNNNLRTSETGGQYTQNTVDAFNSNGFRLTPTNGDVNLNAWTYVSWTFQEQAKFFDIVTYTGDGTNPREIAHNLGSTPGFVVVKRTDSGGNWCCHHRSLGSNISILLNSTAAPSASTTQVRGADSTVFAVGNDAAVNASGGTYVAYLYAHNAGGFGPTGTDNVISCGLFTHTTGTDTAVTLGYEPQWLLIRSSSASGGNWFMIDNMRGLLAGGNDAWLAAQADASESIVALAEPQATGFSYSGARASGDYIYVAIRRGPMKVPTTGTEVYATDTAGATAPNPPLYNSGWPVDLGWWRGNMPNGASNDWYDRLRGQELALITSSQDKEQPYGGGNYSFDSNIGWSTQNFVQADYRAWMFRRSPAVFDIVCYTGTGSARNVAHNLTVPPELIIFKCRSIAGENWGVWVPAFGFSSGILWLNSNSQVLSLSDRVTGISATTVSTGTNPEINGSGNTYVMYLFASTPGVSKVGSYTGNGSSQTINCGFTGGARFVIVKSTNNSGNWMEVDTARGLGAAGDPTLYLNSTAAVVTGNDWIDPDSSGFIVNQESVMNANVNGANYIFLAIA